MEAEAGRGGDVMMDRNQTVKIALEMVTETMKASAPSPKDENWATRVETGTLWSTGDSSVRSGSVTRVQYVLYSTREFETEEGLLWNLHSYINYMERLGLHIP